jgi:hypothetical protein
MPSKWGSTPKHSIEAECERRGRLTFVTGCVDLLEGRATDDDLLIALAGPGAFSILEGRGGGRSGYWPRVWGARGLLHAWDDVATKAIIQGASDESWRVREMVAKVTAAHGVDDAVAAMAILSNDPVPRVRIAAQRALTKLVS